MEAPAHTGRAAWERVAREAAAALERDAPVRCALPGGGRLFMDRALPVVVVHRCAEEGERRAVCSEAHHLVTSQPAYILVSGGPSSAHEGVRVLLRRLAAALRERFGAVLLLEVWAALDEIPDEEDPFNRRPGFTLYVPTEGAPAAAADALCEALEGIEMDGLEAEVTRVGTSAPAPPGLPPLHDGDDDACLLGLAVDAVFLNPVVDEFYPILLHTLRDALAPALTEAAYAFAHRTRLDPPHADALGRRHLGDPADAVDRGIAAAAATFDFLLQVTPVNADVAWEAFLSLDCDRAPELLYRPLTFNPDRLRRRLYDLPLDAVEDPLVAGLLRERRDEIEEQVRLILDRGTEHFLYGSLRLYGAPDDDLVALARGLLARLPPPGARPGEAAAGAAVFAARAEEELDYYRARHDAFAACVQIRDDITSGVMVSKGDLLVKRHLNTSEARVEALVAHEVGTHVLTYYNGAAQPLALLRDGLAGYEDLQEGLAVLAEYLVGGLDAGRMRVLAARVLGAHAMAGGASFVEVYRMLTGAHGFGPRAAFNLAVRLFRGGGLVKDMVYLRGLRDLLRHLEGDGALEPLLVGKIALRHRDAVAALRRRGLLHAPPLLPRHLHRPDVQARLDRVRQGMTVVDLIE